MIKEIGIGASAVPGRHAAVREALRDGVFLVRHPIGATLLDEAYGLLGDFFAMPLEAKMKCRAPGTNGQAGYLPALIETAERSRQPDWKELFHWGRGLPAGHPLRERYPSRYPDPLLPDALVPGIASALTGLHEAVFDFQLSVVDAIGCALGTGTGYFREMLADGPVVNRAAWYPPIAGAPSGDCVWAVEHQDFDLITALPRATSAGLEVRVAGSWHPVTPPEGYAVVVAGMAMERLTGGAVPAVFHRVVAGPCQDAGRLSIVQFCHPTPWTVLTPIEVPAGLGTTSRFPTLTAGDLFDRTMYRINRLDSARTGAARPAASASVAVTAGRGLAAR
ncbi:MAG TPA: 2-oxoglutarate and iron-dependent oxygenase domain-containing protein [Streptosporangiaceae bacterium]|nr:2-oxoglutarate and iron-dependent oxygenase domain-containing protein [Streptosporangiaceae bacterium]